MRRQDFAAIASDFRARVDAELSPARQSIADLDRHFADDVHLTPAQFADYRHRLARYAKSSPQADFDWEPPSCA
jgi:threonine aldolase